MEINNKYDYVRAQELNSSIEFQKQQLIQNGIEEKIFLSKLSQVLIR